MKSTVDADVMTMFGRGDQTTYVRKCSEANALMWEEIDDDKQETAYEYRSTAREVAERLDVMGFTLREAEKQFADGAEYEAEMEERWSEMLADQRGITEAGVDERPLGAVRHSQFLRGLKLEEWIKAVREVRGRRSDNTQQEKQQAGEPTDLVPAYVQGKYGYGDDLFGFPNAAEVDFRTIVRALLEAVDPKAEVVLDYTDLVGGGWYSEEDDLRELTLQDLRENYIASERLILLTEGSTDAGVLKKALEVRYPHLKDYVSFPDFHGSNAKGGAGALANLVKGFGGSGVSNRIVALFDNDAAGYDARRKLDQSPCRIT